MNAERIERAFTGWESALDRHGYRSEIERVWYGKLDEALAAAIDTKAITAEQEQMYQARVGLLDPSCDPEGQFREFEA